VKVGILVLAAGRASRFGADKRLARLEDGRRVIDALLANILESGLPFLVCIGPDDHELDRELAARHVSCVRCSRAGEGMGGTLAEGVNHARDWAGLLVALADMPWVAPTTYRAVARQLSRDGICVPTHDGRRGHPVGFSARFFAELGQLGGDTGARPLLRRHAALVRELEVGDPAIHRDIDVRADLHTTD
jgi:molybdenum cofactor cytidylyltransferase